MTGPLHPAAEATLASPLFAGFPRSALESSLVDRFETIVGLFPRHFAVRTPQGALSYQELNTLANRIAHRLIARGGRQDEPVAILVESSTLQIGAVLGVLKAGRIVAPLDPSYPEDRLALMLSDSGASVILCNREHLAQADRLVAGRSLDVLELESLPATLPTHDPGCPIPPDTLAYLLYSSGSTGRPKGIVHTHRNALQNIRNYSLALRLGPEDRSLMLHSASFSSGVNDLLFTLLNGATLFPWDVKVSGLDALGPWIATQGITILNWSPTTYRHLLESLPKGLRLSSLRVVMLGSEPVTRLDWELYHGHFGPECVFINRLGSTECNNYRLNVLHHASQVPAGTIPGGYAIEDKEVLILDEAGQALPAGEIGQIAIRSRYLSPGYWRRPDLTAAAFRPDPDGGDRRIYLTGDFGRVQPDGCLEYLGRKDSQLKFHGVRIEAAEIELALTRHPNIRDAIASVQADGQGHSFLAAHVVARSLPAPSAQELHRFLSTTLPASLVPSAFVFLDALPLTPSGKVDRRSLPAATQRLAIGGPFIPPATPTERTIAAIWSEILRVERVGQSDHFFNLGGQSLTAVRMLGRIRAAFGKEVPLRTLFEAPALGDFAVRVDRLANAASAAPVDSIPHRRPGQTLALSSTQQQLLFLQQLEPANPAYNVSTVARFEGSLDVPALERAITEITRRHEILRAVVGEGDGLGEHRIGTVRPCQLPPIDLSDTPGTARDAAAQKIVARESCRPFDLASEPLLRVCLIRLDPTTHWLVVNVHHIVFDGASTGIFMDELAALYSAFVAGQASPLPELPVQFPDVALWQRQRFTGDVLAREVGYWKNQLAGAPDLLDLPVDHPRAAARGFGGAWIEFRLTRDHFGRITALAQEEQGTAFMVLLGVFQLLLSRYARQEEVCVGSPMAARTHAETERLIGYFANLVVLRGNLAGNPTFRQLLRQTRQVALDALTHQDTPLEHIVTALNPARTPGQTPLFQAALIFNQEPLLKAPFAGLRVSTEPVHNGAAKFDVTLTVRERADGLHCSLEYRTGLFTADSARRMSEHFSHLLEQVVACPDAQIGSFDLMSAAERQKLLVLWNNTALTYPRELCVHHFFEQQVARLPDATAAVHGTERITYRDLNTRANRLAHRLRRCGVGPEVLVGVFMDRSLDIVVALLGVLKAGGAYVPLDPSYPKDRLGFIAADARLGVLLTQQPLVARLPNQNAPVLLVDAREDEETDENPATEVNRNHLAYVMYTSGSTGRPKGVAIEHRSVGAFIAWARMVYTPQELAGVLFSTSICFDLSVFELFVTLACGGKIILADHALRLPDLPAAGEVTLVNTVPSAIAELMRGGRFPSSVRTVNLCGEALPAALADRIYAHSAAQRVYDLYGPTEDTVYSTYTLRVPGGIATIGRPLANSQVYILDARLRPVPVGVPGELYLGGEGLARGYLHRPELTAERFVPNPFGKSAGERLYRTGDLCRYLADGNIEFLGRIDHQLKIRGYRIELGEIESVIREFQPVKDCVVVARESTAGDKRLVAYVAPAGPVASFETSALRDHLKQKLPEYMVPALFLVLERLPLTPNGKIDRRALPAPDLSRDESAAPPVAPRTTLELAVARVWREVLNVQAIGIHDNFFALGGHSLLAARLTAELEKIVGRRLPIASLFHAPTVAALAKLLSDGSASPWTSLVPLQTKGSDLPLFCIHGWGGHVYHFLDLAQELGPDRPVYGLQAVGLDGGQPRHRTVEEMAAHYAREIRMVQPLGPYHLIGYSLGGWIAFGIAQELRRQGQDVALLGLIDTRVASRVPWTMYARGVLPYIAESGGGHLRRWLHGPDEGRWAYACRVARSAVHHLRLNYLWRQLAPLGRQGIAPAPAPIEPPQTATPANTKHDYFNLVASRYKPATYHGDIDLFVGEDSKSFMHAFWRHLIRGRVRVHRVRGHHYTLLDRKHLAGFLPAFKAAFEDAQRRGEKSRAKNPCA